MGSPFAAPAASNWRRPSSCSMPRHRPTSGPCAADDAGNVYAATGSPARVYRITPDGKSDNDFPAAGITGPGAQGWAGRCDLRRDRPGWQGLQDRAQGRRQGRAPNASDSKATDTPSKDPGKPALDPSWTSSEYFAPGTKYIWDLLLDKAGNLFVATGDHGEIYKVTPKGEHSLFFKSDETHIRVLALDARGNLIAGTDGSGLVYRISPAGEGFVLYSAPKKEITALALDHDGNIYAAGVGEKRPGSGSSSSAGASMLINMGSNPSSPGGPQTAGGPVPTTTSPGPVGPFPVPGGSASGGSDVYRIAGDGSPSRIWTFARRHRVRAGV